MRLRLTLFAILLATAAADAASVSGVLQVRGAAAANAVVYLESDAGAVAAPVPPHVVMDQRNLTFVPRVLPVTVGTTVEFTNSDDIQHNVFSPTKSADAFDLGHYSRGDSRTVTMREPGDVLVLCNIHMEMEAHILVVRDPYFAVTDARGGYQITDVPPGRYTLKVWERTWLPFTQAVEVTGGDPVTLDVAVTR
jgi:plastocyanin